MMVRGPLSSAEVPQIALIRLFPRLAELSLKLSVNPLARLGTTVGR